MEERKLLIAIQSAVFTFAIKCKRGVFKMASGKNVVPEAKEALNRFKMEAAAEVGVFLH